MAIFGIYVKFLGDIPSSKNHGGWTFRPIPFARILLWDLQNDASGISPRFFFARSFLVDDVLWPPQDYPWFVAYLPILQFNTIKINHICMGKMQYRSSHGPYGFFPNFSIFMQSKECWMEVVKPPGEFL